MSRIAIFTDLDGTLLDHSTYSYQAASQALEAIKSRDIPLILASSKTAAEIQELHRELELGQTPAIVENGAGIYDPTLGLDSAVARDYKKIRKTLDDIPSDLRRHFKGFGDLTTQEVSDETGLGEQGASLAKTRCFSEPGLWLGTEIQRRDFINLLMERGIHARKGGRFLTLGMGATKADQMEHVTERLGASVTIALGDAPNDVELLERADHGVIIANEHSTALPTLSGEETGRITRTKQIGPIGWNAAVLNLINQLAMPKGS